MDSKNWGILSVDFREFRRLVLNETFETALAIATAPVNQIVHEGVGIPLFPN